MNKTESKLVLELRAANAKFQKDIDEANRKLEQHGQIAERQSKRVAQGFKEMDVAARKANHSIGKSSNTMNAFGMQMQDVIVQAQAGTSPFTILAQQGSQLASVFGPTGALIGGVVALSAALGGMLWRALDAAAAEADEAREAFEKLIPQTPMAQLAAMDAQIKASKGVIQELKDEVLATTNAFNSVKFSSIYIYGSPEDVANAQSAATAERLTALKKLQQAEQALKQLIEDRVEVEAKASGGKTLEENRKYYADLWKLEKDGQAFIDDLVKEALEGRAKMDKEAQEALLKQAREFNQQLASIQSGQIKQDGPESQENALFAKNMKALQEAANSKLQLEYDINALIEGERARHAAVMTGISNKAIQDEMALERQRVDFVDDMAKEALEARRKYEEDVRKLLEEYDPITREKSVHAARLAMLQNEHNQRLMTEVAFNAALEKERKRHEIAMSQAKIQEMQASGDHIGALMEKYRFDAANSAAFIEEKMAGAIDGFVGSLSQGIAQAIVYGEDLRDVFDQVGKMILTSVLQGMIQLGTQILINKAIGSAATAATTTEQVASMGAVSAAAAPAAAGVSAATAGANTVPASAGLIALYAVAGGLAVAGLAGMAHDGIASVPKEGTWLLDKGERVLSSDHNERFVKALEEGGGRSSVNVTNVFQVSAGIAGTVRAEIEKTIPAIQRMSVAAVEQALRAGGSTSRAAGVR